MRAKRNWLEFVFRSSLSIAVIWPVVRVATELGEECDGRAMANAEQATGGTLAEAQLGAFNYYNTDIVKFDALKANQMANGDLIRRGQAGDETDETGADLDLVLLAPDYELAEHLIPADSINVNGVPLGEEKQQIVQRD